MTTAWRVADLAEKLMVKVRLKSGTTVDVEVLDISPGGCMVRINRWGEAGERVLLKLPNLAFQPAEIVWVEDGNAGIAFEQAMHEVVLDHLWQALGKPAAA